MTRLSGIHVKFVKLAKCVTRHLSVCGSVHELVPLLMASVSAPLRGLAGASWGTAVEQERVVRVGGGCGKVSSIASVYVVNSSNESLPPRRLCPMGSLAWPRSMRNIELRGDFLCTALRACASQCHARSRPCHATRG